MRMEWCAPSMSVTSDVIAARFVLPLSFTLTSVLTIHAKTGDNPMDDLENYIWDVELGGE
jgi:hypothetical protein